MSSRRVVVFGYGPMPIERLPITPRAARSWQLVSALRAAGHTVCFVARRDGDAYAADLPPILTQHTERLSYYSAASDVPPESLSPLVPGWGADCAVAVTSEAAAAAGAVVGYLPLWADLGDEQDCAAALPRADAYSCVSAAQHERVRAELCQRGWATLPPTHLIEPTSNAAPNCSDASPDEALRPLLQWAALPTRTPAPAPAASAAAPPPPAPSPAQRPAIPVRAARKLRRMAGSARCRLTRTHARQLAKAALDRALRRTRVPYRAHFVRYEVPNRMQAGQTYQCPVQVQNEGTAPWFTPVESPVPTHVSYRWRAAGGAPLGGEPLEHESLRSPLPRTVHDGEHVRLALAVAAPERPGRYLLRLDLVQHGKLWFSEAGARCPEVPVEVC